MATGQEDRVLTQNVWVNAPTEVANKVLGTLLEQDPDIIALQEWPGSRNPLFKDNHGAFLRVPATRRTVRRRTWRPQPGYVWTRPILGPTGPIGMRADRYELVSCRGVTLTGPLDVTPKGKHQRTRLPANRVTAVVARDHELAHEVAVLGFHLFAGVQVGSGYSTRPEDEARVQGHRDQVTALRKLVQDQLAQKRVVFALGDSNFDGLDLPGLVSAWDGREEQKRGTHREGERKIDDVFGPTRPRQVILIDHQIKEIDHQGVLAVWRRD